MRGKGDGGVKDFLDNTWKNRAHVVMALPAFLVLFFIMYVPMTGLVMAFKSFDYAKGIFGSPWVGLDNFKFLLASKSTFYSMTRNTVLYYLLFTSVGTVLNVALAIALDQLLLKRMAKTMQTLMIIPVFISYAAVQFIVYAFISSDTGLINNALGTSFRFYSKANYWPWVLLVVKMWKDTGYGSVLYMSVLSGIDTSLYEAADIDGASGPQKLFYVTIPALKNTIAVTTMLRIIWVANSVDVIWNMTEGGPAYASQTLSVYVYKQASALNMGYASAMAIMLMLMLLLVAIPYLRITFRSQEG